MKTIQEIRVVLDTHVTDIKKLGKSRELALALTTLEQGRMLLGKTLGMLGEATPYPQSDNPKSSVVEPASDTAKGYKSKLSGDAVADIKTVRAEVETVLQRLELLKRELWARDYGTMAEVMFNAAVVQITLSKMWLGMQLPIAAGK